MNIYTRQIVKKNQQKAGKNEKTSLFVAFIKRQTGTGRDPWSGTFSIYGWNSPEVEKHKGLGVNYAALEQRFIFT